LSEVLNDVDIRYIIFEANYVYVSIILIISSSII